MKRLPFQFSGMTIQPYAPLMVGASMVRHWARAGTADDTRRSRRSRSIMRRSLVCVDSACPAREERFGAPPIDRGAPVGVERVRIQLRCEVADRRDRKSV